MSKKLKLTLAQLNPTVGDIDGNAQKIMDIWQESNEQSCDLVLFPELFLCGYPIEDLTLNLSFIQAVEAKIDFLCQQSIDFKTAALIPTIWRDNEIYNAALLIENGKIKHIFKKHKLPNYTVFDEVRTFKSADLPKPVNFRGVELGIMICEDTWFEHVPKYLKDNGAELLISINASPYSSEQVKIREDIMASQVKETGLSLIYLNMVGGQDEIVFDGLSFVMNKNAEITHQAPAFKEDIIHLDINNNVITTLKNTTKKEDDIFMMYEALKIGLKDYIHKNGFKDVILGLSGGIDSALVAKIAVDALGEEHVSCFMLPSEFTSKESLQDAKQCAEMLNVSCETIPIFEAVKVFENIIPDLNGIAHENTQSRIRGAILMALSNISGALLLTTGNKSEIAVGYCTIYGDMNGGFNPIKDLYKTEVYKLSKWLGLPENIITKEPTAELRENQTDQDSLPPYDELDEILKALIENDNAADINIKYKAENIAHIAKLLKISEYKRYQAAPGTRITSKAFGRDRRYPMTNNFVNKIAKTD